MRSFEERVIDAIKQIPTGKVATYGQIAGLAGSPRAAITVGGILRRQTQNKDLPWQRVISREGRISIVNMEFPPELQAELLKAEGVAVALRGSAYFIDLQKYRWCVEI